MSWAFEFHTVGVEARQRDVRFARVVDMINTLTTAQLNGMLERALCPYINSSLLLLDELG
jgi:DNA replication protein DnaC